jgi:hypothetical protein
MLFQNVAAKLDNFKEKEFYREETQQKRFDKD